MTGTAKILPCTPAGVMKILEYYNIQVEGKNCVVVGRSNIVGKPMAMLLLQANGTVTICHSRTKNLKEICREADILVAAIGKPKFITEEYIKEGAVIVDVGINRDENGKLCGDVDFEAVKDKVYAITPVPGGCGPMTIAMLMQNTYDAFMEAKI
jgi:methylenetetrahydrofolate dehydrogenase (NADP+)/methenyltetrahydrofolate cyclohydrolase